MIGNIAVTSHFILAAIVCDPPPYVPNAVSPPDYQLHYLETFSYKCINGYTTDDEICTVCKADGSLSLTDLPTCESKKL